MNIRSDNLTYHLLSCAYRQFTLFFNYVLSSACERPDLDLSSRDVTFPLPSITARRRSPLLAYDTNLHHPTKYTQSKSSHTKWKDYPYAKAPVARDSRVKTNRLVLRQCPKDLRNYPRRCSRRPHNYLI